MKRNIAFLRAINVGGYRKIKMQDLRDMFESMGFENVKTYIQSGNVIFDTNKENHQTLSQSIQKRIKSDFGHDVPVMIRTAKQLKRCIDQNPFESKTKPPFRLYVTFFMQSPSKEKKEDLKAQSSEIEKYDFIDSNLFSLIDKGADQKVNFSNGYVEKIIGIPGTGRNWRSVNKIYEIASSEV